MTAEAISVATKQGSIGRSIAALFAGFVTVVVASLVTDEILHLLKFYPPWGQPMRDPGANTLALAYRTLYNVLGGYVTAMIAPRNPVKHAVILGSIGLFFGIAGAIATLPLNLGPAWYPIGIAVTALPFCWLGGFLYSRKSGS